MLELGSIGLDGSFQIHQAPLVLVLDDRANQVFVGFDGEGFESARRAILTRYELGTRCRIFRDGDWCDSTLDDWKQDETLVIPAQSEENPGGVAGLVWVVDRLLGPGGCPWDIEQTHSSLRKYLLEESYELIEAIDREDWEGMKEELGDVLLQPLMHTQIRKRDGDWGIEEVAKGISDKLIRRHPHVFGDLSVADSDEVLRNWDAIKRTEKGGDEGQSVLAGIPREMPALMKAMEVSKRAARSGFEWPDLDSVWEKFREELKEVEEAVVRGDRDDIRDELGDLLFTVVNISRWLKVDAEDALRIMVERFRSRFMRMEALSSVPLSELGYEEWDRLWEQAKRDVKSS